jgi:hypothetical protein
MDIPAAYREVGSYRGAAAMCGTTHKTVRRVVERHNSGGAALERRDRAITMKTSGAWSPSGCARARAGSPRSGWAARSCGGYPPRRGIRSGQMAETYLNPRIRRYAEWPRSWRRGLGP